MSVPAAVPLDGGMASLARGMFDKESGQLGKTGLFGVVSSYTSSSRCGFCSRLLRADPVLIGTLCCHTLATQSGVLDAMRFAERLLAPPAATHREYSARLTGRDENLALCGHAENVAPGRALRVAIRFSPESTTALRMADPPG